MGWWRRWSNQRRADILSWYVKRKIQESEMHRDDIRRRMAETGKRGGRISRVTVYEQDVRLKDRLPDQGSSVLDMRIGEGNGRIEFLNDVKEVDMYVWTDWTMIVSVAAGYYERIRPDGSREVFSQYDVMEAAACGRLVWKAVNRDGSPRTGAMNDLEVLNRDLTAALRDTKMVEMFRPKNAPALDLAPLAST